MKAFRNRVRNPITRPHTHAILAVGAITRQRRMFENTRARQRINRAPRTNRIAPRSPSNPAPRSRTRQCVLIAANPDIWPLTASSSRRNVVRCYACGGAGHLARDCANRKAQTQSQSRVQSQSQTRAQSECSNSKSSNAIASAGSGASQFFSHAEIDSIRVPDALVDTGSSFSMMSASLYAQLPSKPRVYSFENAAPISSESVERAPQ